MKLLTVTGLASTLALAVAAYTYLTAAWAYQDDDELGRLERDRDRMRAAVGGMADPTRAAKVRFQIAVCDRQIGLLRRLLGRAA